MNDIRKGKTMWLRKMETQEGSHRLERTKNAHEDTEDKQPWITRVRRKRRLA